MNDSDRNILNDLTGEDCTQETGCQSQHHTPNVCPEWEHEQYAEPDPPRIVGAYNGVSVAVTRTPTNGQFAFTVHVDGFERPCTTGTFTMPPHTGTGMLLPLAAYRIAWHLYATPDARAMLVQPDKVTLDTEPPAHLLDDIRIIAIEAFS